MDENFSVSLPGYEMQRELGRGAMGVVFAARQPALDRMVAVKVVPKLGASKNVTDRFLREVELCVALSHPNVVKLLDAGETEDFLYLTMELVEGQSMDRVIAVAGALPPAQLLTVMEQLAEALDFVHSKDIIHRDIKPANVMLTAGCAKLMDFGLARGISSKTLTAQDVVVGSPRFLSPETVRDAAMTESSDLYALGVAFHEMATGVNPYLGMELKELLRSIVLVPLPAPSRVKPGIPASLDAVILHLLEKDPDKRTVNAAKLLEEIRAVRSSEDFLGTSWATSQAQLKLLAEGGTGASSSEVKRRPTRPSSAISKSRSVSAAKVSGVAASDSFVLPAQGRSRAALAGGAAALVGLFAAGYLAFRPAPEPVRDPSPAPLTSPTASAAPAPDPRVAKIDALALGVVRSALEKVVPALERDVFKLTGGPRANPTPEQRVRYDKGRALAREKLSALPFAAAWRELTGLAPFDARPAGRAPMLADPALPLASRRRLYGALVYLSHLDDLMANWCGVGPAFFAQDELAPWVKILETDDWLDSQLKKMVGPGAKQLHTNDKLHDMYLFSGLKRVEQQEVLSPTALTSARKHVDDPLPSADLTARPEKIELWAHTEDLDRLRWFQLDFEPAGGADDPPVTLVLRALTAPVTASRGRNLGLVVHRDLLPPGRYRVRIRAYQLVGAENTGSKLSQLVLR